MDQSIEHSAAWVMFTYVSFFGSIAMMLFGIYTLPIDIAYKGYLVMGLVMVIQSCITLSKTMRDKHESTRLVNRLETARTERLLAGAEG